MRRLFLFVLIIMAPVTYAGTPVVVGADADPVTRHAAEELQHYLQKMTGEEHVLVLDTEALPETAFIVGLNAHTEALKGEGRGGLALKHALEDLGDEGYVQFSIANHLILAGTGKRGTLYAVYGLLEDHYGCRWFTPQVEHIPAQKIDTLPKMVSRTIPVLESREPFTKECMDADWCARNRMNSSAVTFEEHHGGNVRFGRGLFVHTFNVLMPPAEFFGEHPEYYSLVNGERLGERSQLCTTNEEVIRICTERMLQFIKDDPEAMVYSLSQNDWHNYCECDNCTAMADAEDTQMGPMLHLVNAVAEAVAKYYPDKAIETLAYQYTRKAPKTMRPRDNVIIRLCSIECNFMQPLDGSNAEENIAFVKDLKEWSKVSNRLWIWDYVTSFRSYLCPYPNLRVRDDNIRLFVDNNVTGIFEQDVYNTPGGELSPLSGYLDAKLLWNPDYDEDTAINEFLDGVYGAAAPAIREYIDLMHDYVATNNIQADIWVSPRTAPFLTDALLEEASLIWDQAEAAVEEQPAVLDRVQVARLSVEYAILDRQNATSLGGLSVDHENLTATVDPAFTQRVKHFFEVARRAGVTLMDEHRETLDQYEETFAHTQQGETMHFEAFDAVDKDNLKPGLHYGYYEGSWDALPDFATLEAKTEGISPTVNINRREDADQFGLYFHGYIDIPRDGVYAFFVESNDGSDLFIHDQRVVDNDGLHGSETRGGVIALRKGFHPIRVRYFQAGGGYALKIYWSGPDLDKSRLPLWVLKHE